MPLVLKDLYYLLLKLSPDASLQGGLGDATSLFVSNPWLRTRIEFAEIVNLSDLLFKELQEQLEQLLPVVSGEKKIGYDYGSSPRAFLPLLRCCTIMLRFLEFDLSLVLERCDILLAVLKRLSAPNLPSHLHECAHVLDGADPEARLPRPAFFLAVLEVFIDEFLVQRQLRKHFIMTDYVSATTDKLLASHGIDGDISAVQELVSGHFLLTYYDDSTFSGFIHSLSWTDEVDDAIPELGLDAALTLLGFIIFVSWSLLQTEKAALQSLVHRRSSAIIASSLQNIRTIYLRDNIRCLKYEKQRIDAGERNSGETEDGQSGISSIIRTEDLRRHSPSTNEADTCNGEAFIECLPGYHKNPSEWDDLVDFIECKRGKDYSSWMRKRKRFRRWQQEKRHGKKKFMKEAGVRKRRSRKAM